MIAGVAAVISLMIVVPAVVVFDAAVLAFPIADEEALTVVMRAYPASALVGRASPIAAMPSIAVAYRIPVAVYPAELGTRADGANGKDPGRRRGSDYDSDRNLSERCGRSDPKYCGKQYCSNEFPHVLRSPLLELAGYSDYPELEAPCIG